MTLNHAGVTLYYPIWPLAIHATAWANVDMLGWLGCSKISACRWLTDDLLMRNYFIQKRHNSTFTFENLIGCGDKRNGITA